jgi:DNA ligase D-like protein (predicted ligase)
MIRPGRVRRRRKWYVLAPQACSHPICKQFLPSVGNLLTAPNGAAQLWSRNGKNFVRQFPEVAKAIESLPEDTAIDGEIVALDADGKPSFALLQGSGAGAAPVVFYAFDLLMLRGRDMRFSRLEERRKRLRKIVDRLPESIRYSETFTVPAATLMRAVRENGLEGIVAKRAGSTYRSGRSGDWLKWRANRGQEFVIGGYVPASNTFDSLLVGYYEGCDLMYAGRVRSGLVANSRRALLSHFAGLSTERCPFRNLPERTRGRWGEGLTAEDMAKCRWLVPRLVATVEFLEWTPELRLRHPRFVGLRADKDPNEVVRE